MNCQPPSSLLSSYCTLNNNELSSNNNKTIYCNRKQQQNGCNNSCSSSCSNISNYQSTFVPLQKNKKKNGIMNLIVVINIDEIEVILPYSYAVVGRREQVVEVEVVVQSPPGVEQIEVVVQPPLDNQNPFFTRTILGINDDVYDNNSITVDNKKNDTNLSLQATTLDNNIGQMLLDEAYCCCIFNNDNNDNNVLLLFNEDHNILVDNNIDINNDDINNDNLSTQVTIHRSNTKWCRNSNKSSEISYNNTNHSCIITKMTESINKYKDILKFIQNERRRKQKKIGNYNQDENNIIDSKESNDHNSHDHNNISMRWSYSDDSINDEDLSSDSEFFYQHNNNNNNLSNNDSMDDNDNDDDICTNNNKDVNDIDHLDEELTSCHSSLLSSPPYYNNNKDKDRTNGILKTTSYFINNYNTNNTNNISNNESTLMNTISMDDDNDIDDVFSSNTDCSSNSSSSNSSNSSISLSFLKHHRYHHRHDHERIIIIVPVPLGKLHFSIIDTKYGCQIWNVRRAQPPHNIDMNHNNIVFDGDIIVAIDDWIVPTNSSSIEIKMEFQRTNHKLIRQIRISRLLQLHNLLLMKYNNQSYHQSTSITLLEENNLLH